ncbi:MAG: hypothetical protein DHS20C15_26480 [Planctomycetota bacterium]|nr:MAG: hypothetical protein DHS20C15_26480 [Planctomycetota bacterium]
MSRHADSKRARARSQRGFTRMEFLQGFGALALLVLLAGVPQSGGADEAALVQSQAHVSRAVSVARELARSSGRPHAVAFDVEHDRLAVVGPKGQVALSSETGQPVLAQLDADLISVRFGESLDTLLVDASGWPLSGGVLHLSSGAHALELRLDEASGWVNAVGIGD